MTAHRCRPRLDVLEPRDAPATLSVGYSAVTRTLTVVGTDGPNQLTIDADPADPTRYLLSSTTDTFTGGGTTFDSPSGVRNVSVRMLAGNDSVGLGGPFGIRVAGSLTIDGGEGANTAVASDLTVGRNLTVRNGTNVVGQDQTYFGNLNVGGGLTLTNGDGGTLTLIQRTAPGVSTVRGPVQITNGIGYDETSLLDLNVGGSVTIRNGHPRADGFTGPTVMKNVENQFWRSQVKGSVSVSHLSGIVDNQQLTDVDVGGSVSYSFGTGGGLVVIGSYRVAEPVLIHGNLTVLGGSLSVGYDSGQPGEQVQPGLVVGRNLTVTGPAGAAVLARTTVVGTTTLKFGDGGSTITVDDSSFAGAFNLTTGAGADTVYLERLGGGTATTFGGAVKMSLGAGVDTLSLGGVVHESQWVVFGSTFVVRHGAEGESPLRFGREVYLLGGDLQWLV